MEHFADLTATFESFVDHYGVFAVSAILALESLGAPVPGETLLIFASILSGRGEISLPALLLSAWAGSVIGDNLGYVIGCFMGRAAVSRFGAKVGLTDERLKKIEDTFKRYGPATVIFARFFNVLRQLNGLVAGTLKMAWRKFLLFNAIGGALWVGVWVLVPAYVEQQFEAARQFVDNASGISVVFVLIGLIILTVVAWVESGRRR